MINPVPLIMGQIKAQYSELPAQTTAQFKNTMAPKGVAD